MAENRGAPRLKRRLHVLFSDGRQERGGYTVNLSHTGLSIRSAHVMPPGTRIEGRLALAPGMPEIRFAAQVMWARKARGPSAFVDQNSMGLGFLAQPDPAYLAFLAQALPLGARGQKGGGATPPRGEARSRLVVGLSAQVKATLVAADLAAPPQAGAAPIAAGAAAVLVERAARAALESALGPERVSLGTSLELHIDHARTIPPGTALVASARLADIGPAGDRVTFEVTLRHGGHAIANARHVRVLVGGSR